MHAKFVTWLVVVGGLALTNHVAGTYARALREAGGSDVLRTRNAQDAIRGSERGLSLAVLGGFRGLAADLIWLRAYVAWERHDAPLTASLLNLATAVDDRPLCFWLNGARMMAYDFPVWELEGLSSETALFAGERERIERQAARDALLFLERGRQSHPMNAALQIESANLQLNRLHDLEGAAAGYRQVAAMPDAPYYAARLHAELLRRLGRPHDALTYLRKLHPQLPQGIGAAGAEVVLSRICLLEAELGVPVEERYQPNVIRTGADQTLTLNDVSR
ncbi:MAG: hypothetical protein ABIV50_03660 [Opitutus sp.]